MRRITSRESIGRVLGSEYQDEINRKIKNILRREIPWSRPSARFLILHVTYISLVQTELRRGVAGGESCPSSPTVAGWFTGSLGCRRHPEIKVPLSHH